MLMKRSTPSDCYGLCDQTVTVYREEDGRITRKVHKRAFLDFRKNLNVDKSGSWETNSFLLVIPGDTQTVFVNDKVLLGEGPEAPAYDQWKHFVPTNVSNLVVVKFTDPKYRDGKIVHTEAGG